MLFKHAHRNLYLFEEVVYEVLFKVVITFYWVFKKKNGVSFIELLRFLFLSTRVSLGKARIKRVWEEGAYLKFNLYDFDTSIYYRRNLSLYSLFLIIGEDLTPNHWHSYEIPEKKIMPGDIVCDCGAAVGIFTVLAAKKCRKVCAIEPSPEYLGLLERTLKDFDNVKIIPYGLGGSEKEAFLTDLQFGSYITEKKEGVPIRVTTLDSLFANRNARLDFLKVDLEGGELEMLRGAEKTIRKYKPKIAIAVYHKRNDPVEISKLLKYFNPNYRMKFVGIDRRYGNPVLLHAW